MSSFRKKSVISSVSVLALVCAWAVACAPSDPGAKIERVKGHGNAKTARACLASMPQMKPKMVTAPDKVMICEYQGKSTRPPYAAEDYKLVARPLKYQVARMDKAGKHLVEITSLIQLDDTFDVDEAAAVKTAVTACSQKVIQAWDRSKVKLELPLFTEDQKSASQVDQVLRLRRAEGEAADGKAKAMKDSEPSGSATAAVINTSRDADETDALFEDAASAGDGKKAVALRAAMVAWPDVEIFVGQAPGCAEACKDTRGVGRDRCVRECVELRNEPFCREFAKLVGHWAGLEDKSASNPCHGGDNPIQETPETSLMKGASRKPRASTPKTKGEEPAPATEKTSGTDRPVTAEEAAEFWKDARLSQDEFAKIFEPACKGFKPPPEKKAGETRKDTGTLVTPEGGDKAEGDPAALAPEESAAAEAGL